MVLIVCKHLKGTSSVPKACASDLIAHRHLLDGKFNRFTHTIVYLRKTGTVSIVVVLSELRAFLGSRIFQMFFDAPQLIHEHFAFVAVGMFFQESAKHWQCLDKVCICGL
jgi:hypothetical protein